MTAIVDAVPPHTWDALSPCEGWSARDVVGHLIETQRETLTGHGVDLGDAPHLAVDPAAAWAEHSRRVLDALADDELVGRTYDGFLGPTTVGGTVEQFHVWDMYVHRWDLARAAGLDAAFTDAELDRIERGADSFGDALQMDGMCRPPLTPTDGDRTTRVLARLGRAG
ncbi:TIGR03086 family protein [Micromonospora citrea]|uniref:TIGR03086 family protein n=1 Tax=Micromonospora citrea TaxID=47855 RepID=A0A1C6TTU9_9ACTN|nr:maleylpyruvate isomerase N-terminal domain-containing protein [Micromonospora citrea]SCL45118.1 TIGR03086 family protein [Micromonospora citrea]